ncbi:ferrochelatase [Psychromarinibacter sp. C21-152]|uniref:Ferrochelatase n=1 Tax=Psychromarinibacter sediminicola TaxID=3033385 RepID=A0AAE3NSD3_9RHOB|nr:ferrochelatase [Psychromarinibacter sediminicola]MDF0601181.1 ferrochelatase [Psychromarinibacter sediminicola]
MKKLVLAAAFATLAGGATAGNYDKVVVVEPEVVVEAAAETGSDAWVIGLMAFLTIVVGAAQ